MDLQALTRRAANMSASLEKISPPAVRTSLVITMTALFNAIRLADPRSSTKMAFFSASRTVIMITTGIGIMIGITIAIEIMTQAALLRREVICVAAGRRLFAATISLPFAKLRMVHG